MQGRRVTTNHGVTRKKDSKRLRHTDNLFRKNLQLKDAFYRQRIPESSCVRKETIVIEIFVTSKNGDRKIM